MNDLEIITALTPDAPLPGPADLLPARARLAAAIQATAGKERKARRLVPGPAVPTRGGHPLRGPRRPGRWLVLAGTAAAVIAAAVTAAALLLPARSTPASLPQPDPDPTYILGGPSGAAGPSGQQPGAVGLTAAEFLDKAAAAVRQQAAQVPGPDQFVYTKAEGPGGSSSYQTWLPVNGDTTGLVLNSGQSPASLPACSQAQAAAGCAEDIGFLQDMPTQPGQMMAYLEKTGIAQPADSDGSSWATNDLFKGLDYVLSTTYLLPAQQAALYEFMAQFPGISIVSNATDAIGRTGVGVEWTYEGASAEIILNPASYAYMGDRTWPEPGFTGAGGYDGTALVTMAFVNQAGQLP